MSRIREDVATVLADIASPDRHYDWYTTTGGQGNLAKELWQYWIRDAYLPHSPDFCRSFTEQEQERLEMFTQFFENRLNDFPPRFQSLMTNVHWVSLREFSNVLLNQMATPE